MLLHRLSATAQAEHYGAAYDFDKKSKYSIIEIDMIQNHKGKIKKLGFGIALVLLGYTALNARSLYHTWDSLFNNPFNDWSFNGKLWYQYHNSSNPNNPRGRMAEDVRQKILTSKMTQQEVLSMFGKSDAASEKYMLSYNLGAWSGFRIDYDTLDVHFDKSGRAYKINLVQH